MQTDTNSLFSIVGSHAWIAFYTLLACASLAWSIYAARELVGEIRERRFRWFRYAALYLSGAAITAYAGLSAAAGVLSLVGAVG